MRALLKYLPLLLTLLIPLGLLAWFGSSELTRLEDRSESLLKEEANRFLTDEERKVRGEIQRIAYGLLEDKIDRLLADADLSVVEASNQLGAEPFILQAFVADAGFNLIAPRAPNAKPPSAPLNTFPSSQDSDARELFRASILTDLGDYQGAIDCYDSYIRRYENSDNRDAGLTWAYFRMAGLLDKHADDPKNAMFTYVSASIQAESICERGPNEDAATVILLCDLRQAQINLQHDEMIRLLNQVCTGRQPYIDWIADDVLDWVVAEIVRDIPGDAATVYAEQRDRALALNRMRAAGRRFAVDYEIHARSRLRFEETSGRLYNHKGVIFHTMTTRAGARLLALRPSHHPETRRFGGRAAWVGLLLDLPALLGSSLAVTPTSAPGNVALAVNDPSGVALLPVPVSANAEIRFPPVVSRLAGLEFVAVPITDPGDIRSAEKTQALLGLFLVIVAAGGAFMLIRSVKRETELAQMKVMLLSRVSHELKTPLAVIKMYGETLGLGRAKDQEQVHRFAGIISTEADRLTNMVERILDFSKMEAGTFTYEKQRIDVGELIETVTDEYIPHLEAQGLQFQGDIHHGLEADVDPRGLASSLVNLLENALKYTPVDAPERSISVSVARQNGSAVLEVRDRGVGIPAGEHDKVFQDFYRASNAGEARGAGLGLSLVDHFARSHEGKIEAISRPSGGTTFRLTLPLAPDSPSQTPAQTKPPEVSADS